MNSGYYRNIFARPRGFTIVELLIVIVVIAVLAAITVVAYGGLQRRAVTQSYAAAADQWEKLIRMEYALTGVIPGADGVTTRCLGNSTANFPAAGVHAANECERISGTPDTVSSYNQAYIDLFSTKNSFPNGALPPIKYDNGAGAVINTRGIVIFAGVSGSSYEVHLYWKGYGKNNCGRGVDNLAGNPSFDISACERVITLS